MLLKFLHWRRSDCEVRYFYDAVIHKFAERTTSLGDANNNVRQTMIDSRPVYPNLPRKET
jgi:hypothetical protein